MKQDDDESKENAPRFGFRLRHAMMLKRAFFSTGLPTRYTCPNHESNFQLWAVQNDAIRGTNLLQFGAALSPIEIVDEIALGT